MDWFSLNLNKFILILGTYTIMWLFSREVVSSLVSCSPGLCSSLNSACRGRSSDSFPTFQVPLNQWGNMLLLPPRPWRWVTGRPATVLSSMKRWMAKCGTFSLRLTKFAPCWLGEQRERDCGWGRKDWCPPLKISPFSPQEDPGRVTADLSVHL